MIKLYLEKRKKCERRKRQFWIRLGHTKQWWLKFLNDEVVADDWKENSRMSKQSLLVLCEELRQCISKNTTRFQKPISVEVQVAVKMYYLSDEG